MPAAVTAFAPGRVNLVGEHTDYNAGLALPFAIEAGITVRAQALGSGRVEVQALDLKDSDSFPLHDIRPSSGWRAFARGAVAELQRAGAPVSGMRLEVTGTVPREAGLASSGALAVALCLAIIELGGGAGPAGSELAELCSGIENRWVGAGAGLLDQLASIHGRAGHALRVDFRSLQIRPVPLELGDWRLVILDCGERRANAASGYNQRRAECMRACQLLGVDSLRQVSLPDAEGLPHPFDRRVRHVIAANQRVDAAVSALERRDPAALGRLLDAAHASLRDLYEVSTPAVETAVGALKAAGAAGARLMGGGFGGVVLGLLPPDAQLPAGSKQVRPGPGARVISAGGRPPAAS